MGSWLRPLGAAAVLFLAGCSADYGVDQDGRPVAAEQLDGHWLVVNYWADWCAPCRTEIPEMNRLAQVLGGQGGRVIGVNFDGLRDAELKKSADGMGIRFTVLADDPAPRFKLPRSEALPVTYIVDARGGNASASAGRADGRWHIETARGFAGGTLMARICLHAYVGGRVQGVGFRQATREEADRLELDGWVRNLDDGRVEVVWEGEEDRAKALERWLGRGPRHAEVSAVEVEQMPLQGIAGFVVRR